jgi:hypothetical protein
VVVGLAPIRSAREGASCSVGGAARRRRSSALAVARLTCDGEARGVLARALGRERELALGLAAVLVQESARRVRYLLMV